MIIVPCEREDEARSSLVDLLYESGPDIYDYLYGCTDKSARDFIRYEYLSGRGFCGYKALDKTYETEDSDLIIAVSATYGADIYNKLVLGTLLNVFLFFGPIKCWPVLMRMLRISSVMSVPKKGEVYLANGAYLPEYRSKGIGGEGLEWYIARYREQGVKRLLLDVDQTNPMAQKFYARHGFKVCGSLKFSGKGGEVPDATVMEMYLS